MIAPHFLGSMHYVYLIRSLKDSSLYIGSTSDLRQRFKEHNALQSQSTKGHAPFELIYYEAYKAKRDALKREIQLKRFSQGYQHLKNRLVVSLEPRK